MAIKVRDRKKGDEMFLVDEGRWENMGTNEEKRTQKHCALDSRGPDDCTFQCNSKKGCGIGRLCSNVVRHTFDPEGGAWGGGWVA